MLEKPRLDCGIYYLLKVVTSLPNCLGVIFSNPYKILNCTSVLKPIFLPMSMLQYLEIANTTLLMLIPILVKLRIILM